MKGTTAVLPKMTWKKEFPLAIARATHRNALIDAPAHSLRRGISGRTGVTAAAMSLHPRVGRALYRSLQRASTCLEAELTRCGALRVRELDSLKHAAGAALPKDLRGLLDVQSRRAMPISAYVGIAARRVAYAALSPTFGGLDGTVGFAALKHINVRLDALCRLVLPTTSSMSTHGVRVEVASSYQGFERSRFHFRYQIRISNGGPRTIQLLSRAWTITDLDGRVSEVQGPGVVGAFPTIRPRGQYEYTSGVPLQTPMGTQSGHFIFHQHGEEDADPVQKKNRPMSDVLLSAEPPEIATVADLANVPHIDPGKVLQVEVAPFSYRTPSLDERAEKEGSDGKGFTSSTSSSRGSTRSRRRRSGERAKRR